MALPYSSALQTSLARVQGLSFMVTTHNSTALKVNGMTEYIWFVVCFGLKICVSGHQTQKPYINAYNFLSCTNPAILMDTKQ